VINAWENLSNTCWVRDHAYCPLHLGKISPWNNSWRLIIDAALEPSGTPINKLDSALGLNSSYSCINIFRDHIASVHQTTGHVLAVSRVALGHHRGRLKCAICDLCNWKLLMVCFLRRNHGGVGWKHEVNPGIWYQVSLKLSNIHIESTIKSQRCSQWWYHLKILSYQSQHTMIKQNFYFNWNVWNRHKPEKLSG